MLDYNKYSLNGKEKTIFIGIGYTVIFLICLLFYHSILLSLVAGSLIVFFMGAYSTHLGEKRRTLLLIQFKDLLYSLSSSMATGRQMGSGLKEALEHLRFIYEEDSPMVQELKHIVRGMEESRESEEKALVDLAKRSGLEDIKNFVDVYLVCQRTGGNLENIVSNASDIILEKMAIQREIKIMTAQKQLEGKIITLMPIGVILGLNLFYPEYLMILYTTFMGRIVMTIALLGILFAYYLTLKMTKIEV